MTKNEWKLTINEQEITLIPTCQTGICSKCQRMKTLHLICEKKIWISDVPSWETKKFCWSCALANLYQLEESDYQVVNKQATISELRSKLNNHE
jgi:hypothetical protein